MKHAKRLASLLLAMVMLLAMGVTSAFAAGGDGSITITNATVGKEYSVYKVFDLTYSIVDDKTNVAYTYTSESNPDAFLTALQGSDSPFALVETTTPGVYNVSLAAGKSASDVSAFLNEQKDNLTPVAKKIADASKLVFENLDYGYYFVTSEVGTVLTIDSTLPDVKVIDKNQEPSWDNEDPNNPGSGNPGKVIIDANGNKVTENTANFGDNVNFSIAVNATAYVADEQITYYYITDTLAAGFSAAENIKVLVNGVEKELSTDYTITANANPDGTNSFQITLPYDAEEYGSNAKIEVTYSATVENDAVLAEGGNLNTANFAYDTKEPGTENPDPNPEPQFPSENEKTTTTYVYALGVVKVDPEGKTLTGAEFSVTDEYNKTIYAKPTDTKGVYEYCVEGTEGATARFATDNDGVLVIKGVEAGHYNVVEEVAPLGYNLLNGVTKVTAELKEQYTTTITTYLDADGKVTNEVTNNTKEYKASASVAGLVIVNNKGTELPSTGGMGTTLFYALGGVLAVGAAVLLVVKKRMGRAAQ